MSLGWIKVTVGLCNKPEVMTMARRLEISKNEMVGILVQFWSWADGVTVDGVVDAVVAADVDAVVATPGFARTLELVKWLKIDDEKQRIFIPNFDRHNGESAKKRALKSERQARWRRRGVDVSVDAHVDATSSTREEKRRSKNKTQPPDGGSSIWDFGKTILAEQGLSTSSAGALIGSWLRDWPESAVSEAIRAAAGKADAKSYVAAVLKTKPRKGAAQELKVAMP